MRRKKEIEQALAEMETRKKAYLLDMASYNHPNSVQYNTDIIRKLEVTDATVQALKWVLFKEEKKPKKRRSEP